MANAGCINAIGYNGCFLETLQQLDSACIGVGVQYTAPDPLYDKRLDYITYTDKCGCSCCISGENEILILATQGTLKNLTLTNDDTNEVVNVKRTDLFGSNWKKTVVRYKTGSFPTSVTDGTLAVEETTMNQYSSTGFDVSGLDDATTYYFSVFAIAQDDTVIVVQSDSITTDFLRGKYQKVERIGTTGTQFINTNLFAQSNHQIETKIAVNRTIASSEAVSLFGSYGSPTPPSYGKSLGNYLHLTTLNNKWYIGRNNSEVNGGSFYGTIGNQYTVIFNDSNSNVLINGSSVGSSSGCICYNSTTLAISIRGTTSGNNINHGYYNFYYFKIYDKNTGKYVREMIPCYRKSDNVIGMLDTVNKVFYTNQGTGSFTKGGNV